MATASPAPPPHSFIPVLLDSNVVTYWIPVLAILVLVIAFSLVVTCNLAKPICETLMCGAPKDKMERLTKLLTWTYPDSSTVFKEGLVAQYSKSKTYRAVGQFHLVIGSILMCVYAMMLLGFPEGTAGTSDFAEKIQNYVRGLHNVFLASVAFMLAGFWFIDLAWNMDPSGMVSLGDILKSESASTATKSDTSEPEIIENKMQALMVYKYYHADVRTQVQFSVFLLLAFLTRRDPLLQILCWLIYSTAITFSYARSFVFYVTLDFENFSKCSALTVYWVGTTFSWLLEWFALVAMFNTRWEASATGHDYGLLAEFPINASAVPFSAEVIEPLKSYSNKSWNDAIGVMLVTAQVVKVLTYIFAWVYAIQPSSRQFGGDQSGYGVYGGKAVGNQHSKSALLSKA
jgi:hypothetical protein